MTCPSHTARRIQTPIALNSKTPVVTPASFCLSEQGARELIAGFQKRGHMIEAKEKARIQLTPVPSRQRGSPGLASP